MEREAILDREGHRLLKKHYSAARRRARNWEANQRRKIMGLERRRKLKAASAARASMERIRGGFLPHFDEAASEQDYKGLVSALFERIYSLEETRQIAQIMGCMQRRDNRSTSPASKRGHVMQWMRQNNPVAFTEVEFELAQRLAAAGQHKRALAKLDRVEQLWKRSATFTIKSDRASTLSQLRRREGVSPRVGQANRSTRTSPLVVCLLKKIRGFRAKINNVRGETVIHPERAAPEGFSAFDIFSAAEVAYVTSFRRRSKKEGKKGRFGPRRTGPKPPDGLMAAHAQRDTAET